MLDTAMRNTAMRNTTTATGEITQLLIQLKNGDKQAEALLLPMVYRELRRIARNHLRREAAHHSLQPTALVHEAYMRFARIQDVQWDNRLHFFAMAATLMRRVLVDHARASRAEKRGAGCIVVKLDEALVAAGRFAPDTLALDQALDRLSALDERQAKVVELRYFGGLSDEEIAQVLQVSSRTVKRDWRVARAFLYQELSR